jgi:hypothetical protein
MQFANIAHSVTFAGVTLVVYHVDKGVGLPRHEHPFPHLTMVHAGKLIARKENKQLVMTKETQPVNLVADEWHELEALEDGTVFVNVFVESKY